MKTKETSTDQSRSFLKDFEKRQEVRNRLPIWLAMLMPLVLLSLTFGIAYTVVIVSFEIHRVLHPMLPDFLSHAGQNVTVSIVITFIFSFLIGVSTAIPLGNFLLWVINPIRKRLNENAKGVADASYGDAITTAKQMILYVAIPSAILLSIGIWAPWE